MKINKTTMIFGILFGLALLPLAYVYFALGFALAFSNNGWFIYVSFVMAGLGIATFVGALLVNKFVIVTRVIFTLSTCVFLASIIYLAVIGLFAENIGLLMFLVAIGVWAVLSTIFAFLSKPKEKTILQ